MILGAVTVFVIVGRSGGLAAAMERVAAEQPELLVRGAAIRPLELLSYTAIPLSVGMFPHIFMHWLTARGAAAFRLPVFAYPLCVGIVWLPSVLLGVIGAADVPGLEGPAANAVLIRMISLHAPEVLAGLLAAGVIAAVMSSLDSQILALSSLFTEDILRHHRLHDRMSEQNQVRTGRLLVAGLLALVFVLSLAVDRSIFRLGIWSFTGFAGLFPLVVAALYWRRSTLGGAYAAILTTVTLWSYFIVRSWNEPGYSVAGTGLMPVAVILAGSALSLVAVSLLSRPPEAEHLDRFF
jgi:SSS family solute:Na+ symporter